MNSRIKAVTNNMNFIDFNPLLKLQLLAVIGALLISILFKDELRDIRGTASFYFFILIFYQILSHNNKNRNQRINEERTKWMSKLLGSLSNQSSIERFFIHDITNTQEEQNFRTEELGEEAEFGIPSYIPPDVEIAEESLVKAEERSSILIALIIFVPLLFALSHLFRSVSVALVFVEINSLVLILFGVSKYYTDSFKITGWEQAVNDIITNRDIIVSQGRRAQFYFRNYYSEVRSPELNFDSKPVSNAPSVNAVTSLLAICARLPFQERRQVVNKFIKSIEVLPEKEKLMSVRWGALKGRVIFVGIVGMMVTGIFAGLASFTLPVLFVGIDKVKPTAGLHFALFVLSLFAVILISKHWLSEKELWVWSFIWSGLFWLAYFSVNLFIFT